MNRSNIEIFKIIFGLAVGLTVLTWLVKHASESLVHVKIDGETAQLIVLGIVGVLMIFRKRN